MNATTRDRPDRSQKRTGGGAHPRRDPRGPAGQGQPASRPRSAATTVPERRTRIGDEPVATGTLVWIDARAAAIIRWDGSRAEIERLESEVPAHRRATGHIRHDPVMRHGGGGGSQTAGEPHRLEHLARFVDEVASKVAPDDDLIVIGPGTVREHLERQIRDADRHRGSHRVITGEASARRTDRQLIARLRHAVGADPRRRTVGAARGTEPTLDLASRDHGRPGRGEVKRPNRTEDDPSADGGERDGA